MIGIFTATTGLITLCRFTPWSNRMRVTLRRFTFTTTVRVIDRVHDHTARLRTAAQPAAAPGFTDRNGFIFHIA